MAGAEEYEEVGHGELELGPLVMVGMLVCIGLVVPWYMSTSSEAAAVVEAAHHFLLLSPLLLLIALKLLSALESADGQVSMWGMLEPASSHGHGNEVAGASSPFIVGLFLAIIFFMMRYQSGFQQYWHPIVRS